MILIRVCVVWTKHTSSLMRITLSPAAALVFASAQEKHTRPTAAPAEAARPF